MLNREASAPCVWKATYKRFDTNTSRGSSFGCLTICSTCRRNTEGNCGERLDFGRLMVQRWAYSTIWDLAVCLLSFTAFRFRLLRGLR